MNTPTIVVPASAPRPWWDLVSPWLVSEYVQLVRETRAAQRLNGTFRDGRLSEYVSELETRVDQVTAELTAAIAATKTAPATAEEGGAL